MTSKEELQTKILYLEKELEDLADCHSSKMKEIEAKIDNIKEQIEDDEEPSGLWKPKEGEEYWYIDSDSDVLNTNYYDEGGFSIGNCFKTQEEAEKALERLKIRRQLKDIAERLNGGREIDWGNADDKYCLSLYFKEEITIRTQKYLKMQDAIYCLDKNFKDVAIAEIGEERLRNYLKEC